MPFDAAHAIGNVTLALIAGPAMVRMLVRFRERFEWGGGERRGAPRPAASLGLRGGGVAALLLALPLAAAPPGRAGAGRAADWLDSVQNADGGFGASPGDGSSAGDDRLGDARPGGRRPQPARRLPRRPHPGRLPARAASASSSSTGDLARTILALEGAGRRPALLRRPRPGRRAGQAPPRQRLLRRLAGRRPPSRRSPCAPPARPAASTSRSPGCASVQNDDGGWGDVPGSPSTADGTGAVMQAIARGSKAADRGLSYLRKAPAPRRRLPARRLRRGQLPVDRLGGPGDARRRRRPRLVPPRRQQRPRLPRRPPGERRPLPLLGLQRPDPGLGDRRGPGRRRRRVLPGPAAAARATASRHPRADELPSLRRSPLGARLPGASTLGHRLARHAGAAAGSVPLAERLAAPRRPHAPRRQPPASPARGRERGGVRTRPNRRRRRREPLDSERQAPAARRPGSRSASASPPAASPSAPPGWLAPSLRLVAAARSRLASYARSRWTSRPRSAPAAPTRPSAPSRCRARRSRSCSSWRAGRRTTT